MENGTQPINTPVQSPQQPPVEPTKSEKPKLLLIFLVVLEIITVLTAVYFAYQFSQLKKQITEPQSTPLPVSRSTFPDIEIYFSPNYILGDTPPDTQKNISRFIKSTNLGISITNTRDPNIHSFIVIWGKNINQDLIDRVKKDPLVSAFIVGTYTESPSGSGPTYQIEFKEGLYNKTLLNFVNKYPEVKNNLEVDYFSLPLEPVIVAAKLPIEIEKAKECFELKSKYPNVIIEVKSFEPGIL